MRIWILKAFIQKTISLLPFKHQINFLFQKYVTRGVVLTNELFADKILHCSNHIHCFRKYETPGKSFIALEIGTGWYPIVPIGLFLAGAQKIYTLDISSLLNEERIRQTIEKFVVQSEKGFAFEVEEEKLAMLKKLLTQNELSKDDLLQELNIVSVVGDARKISLENGSVNLITSNNTFEHIYSTILVDILKEFKRILKPGGVMNHAIDMSDHFAHLDHSISPYNFLKFSEKEWNWIDNSIQPQNRMRLCEFEQLYRLLDIPVTERVIANAGNDSIDNVLLDRRFADYSKKENAILHASLASKI